MRHSIPDDRIGIISMSVYCAKNVFFNHHHFSSGEAELSDSSWFYFDGASACCPGGKQRPVKPTFLPTSLFNSSL
jgi:hypothetical protein